MVRTTHPGAPGSSALSLQDSFEPIHSLDGLALPLRTKVELYLRRLISVYETSSWVMTYAADLGKEALWFLGFDDV